MSLTESSHTDEVKTLCAPNEWAERQTRFPLHLGHVRGKSEGIIFFGIQP